MSTPTDPADPLDPTAGTPSPQAKPDKFCLYLLVCNAETGPLAGLFKLGITNCLARRHHEHRRHWEKFDLARSVVVWAENREEVQYLESTVRFTYGAPRLEAMARAAHRTLSSEELIAAGSCRRYPGRRVRGWTEFYTMACYGDVGETLEHCVGRRIKCKASVHLQRGITLADVGLPEDGDLPLGRAHGPGSAKRKQALRQQEWDELDRRVEAKLGEVLDFALAHEHALRWVNLDWWRHLRAIGKVGASSEQGLVDLYFGPFDPARAGTDPWSDGRSAAQIRFEESFARIDPVAAPVAPRRWRWTQTPEVCGLRGLPTRFGHSFPHPVCEGTLRLRVEPELSNLEHPLYERFAALGRRVAGRLAGEQME